MKKTYKTPVTKVMDINTEELICLSLQGTATTNSVLVRERGTRSTFILDDVDE